MASVWTERDRRAREELLRLARRVRGLRESMGLRQEDFAERCGISVSFASLLERGERSPSYETLVEIAHALGVPLTDLFRDGPVVEAAEPAHGRLLDFARKGNLTRAQVERMIRIGAAAFDIDLTASGIKAGQHFTCSVHGCVRPVLAKGLCAMHYHRVRRSKKG